MDNVIIDIFLQFNNHFYASCLFDFFNNYLRIKILPFIIGRNIILLGRKLVSLCIQTEPIALTQMKLPPPIKVVGSRPIGYVCNLPIKKTTGYRMKWRKEPPCFQFVWSCKYECKMFHIWTQIETLKCHAIITNGPYMSRSGRPIFCQERA